MSSCNVAYANYEYARKLPYAVVNKLLLDCPELWKLMKYDKPLGKPDLTMKEKTSMICPDSMNIGSYNVIFQKFSQEAVAPTVFAQFRLQVLGNSSKSRTTGRISLVLEFVVNDKQMVCDTNLTRYDNRAMAMTQCVLGALNGVPLDVDSDHYLYMNGDEDLSSRFKLVTFNNEFSGYQMILNANILG